MDRLLQFLIAGLSAGSLYTLVALGLVLVYRSTRVLNFAHGEVATLGTFVAWSLVTAGHSFGLALAAGVLAGLFGVGGGVIIVPGLVLLARLDQHSATGTSLNRTPAAAASISR